MTTSGAAVTCVPVQLDSGSWEAAIFFQVGGPESKQDRRVLRASEEPLPMGMETDLVSHENAAVVLIRLEVFTALDDPLVGEVLITPGAHETHFETLKLLSQQQRLCCFFGDEAFWLIHSQQIGLDDAYRAEFDDLLRDATNHDALTRCTGRYDPQAALSNIASHYELRTDVSQCTANTENDNSIN